MIQFNLLPDVKQQYLKAKRQKHAVIVISMMVAAASLAIFVMMLVTVYLFQPAIIKRLNSSIEENTATLKQTKDLNKILTIQNQLAKLPELHGNKPVVTRLSGYLAQMTPAQISIGELEVDFEEKTMVLKGKAPALQDVNKFVDTMKFTTQSVDGKESADKPFTGVVMSEFSRNSEGTTYTINLSYDDAIFDNGKTVVLTVPKITSTRSETEKPTELFQALPTVKKQ